MFERFSLNAGRVKAHTRKTRKSGRKPVRAYTKKDKPKAKAEQKQPLHGRAVYNPRTGKQVLTVYKAGEFTAMLRTQMGLSSDLARKVCGKIMKGSRFTGGFYKVPPQFGGGWIQGI